MSISVSHQMTTSQIRKLLGDLKNLVGMTGVSPQITSAVHQISSVLESSHVTDSAEFTQMLFLPLQLAMQSRVVAVTEAALDICGLDYFYL